MRYQVERRPQGAKAAFRCVLRTDNAYEAWEKYTEIANGLRKGAVRILVDGVFAGSTCAKNSRA